MRTCALCKERARAFCESDQASLCWSCDANVHGANFLVARHSRTLLCHRCQTPTPWKASGPKLGHTVSFCDPCVVRSGSGELEEGGGDNDDDDDEDRSDGDGDESGGDDEDGEEREEEDVAEEGDNQVVPWSSGNPPPPASCSSSEEEEELAGRSCCGGDREVDEVRMCSSLKRMAEDSVDLPSQELIQQIRWQASTTTVKATSDDTAAASSSIYSSRPAKGRRIGPVEFSTYPDWADDL